MCPLFPGFRDTPFPPLSTPSGAGASAAFSSNAPGEPFASVPSPCSAAGLVGRPVARACEASLVKRAPLKPEPPSWSTEPSSWISTVLASCAPVLPVPSSCATHQPVEAETAHIPGALRAMRKRTGDTRPGSLHRTHANDYLPPPAAPAGLGSGYVLGSHPRCSSNRHGCLDATNGGARK